MSTITYNGATIDKCKITRFSFENDYEGENFNRTGKRVTLEGVGIISSTTWATTATNIKNTLSVPGKKLSITFDDTASTIDLADGYAGATTAVRDVKNGPLPSVNITEVVGTSNQVTFVIGFTFVWNDCNNGAIQRAEMVTTHSLNEDGVLRVTRRGFLRISAANTGTNTLGDGSPKSTVPFALPALGGSGSGISATTSPSNPDLWRRFVSGPPVTGFQRVKQEFYVQADQTTLAFDIEDVQLINSLPAPAIGGDGSFEYERSLSTPTGMKTFRLELVGAPTENKSNLFVRCLEVALTRIRFVPPTPDIIQSFKVIEPSLFKRNSVVIEIQALGQITGNAANEPTNPEQVDGWLYEYLFADPTSTKSSAADTTAVDAYGAFKEGSEVPTFRQFRYDPCSLSNTWSEITGTQKGKQVSGDSLISETQTPVSMPDGTAVANEQSDPILKNQAANLVRYKSSQTMDVVTNVDLLDAMGGDIQSAFQFAMPHAIVRQTVEMVTRDRNAAIAWPYLNEQYVVISMNVAVNDGPPDTSGNRVYAVRAERVVRVNVAVSNNRWITQGGSNFASFAGGGEVSTRLVNYMPTSLATGRNPISGWAAVDVRKNENGEYALQNFSSGNPTLA